MYREAEQQPQHFESLQHFVESYSGPKLRLLLTGAGSYASGLIGVAGASNVVDSLYIPYSHEACSALLRRHHPSGTEVIETHGSVSPEMAVALHLCNSVDIERDVIPITVTAAITTTRYRKGENRAYIVVGAAHVSVWQLKLDKLEEQEHVEPAISQKRYLQDRIVSTVALCLGSGFTDDVVDALKEGGHLVPL